MEDKMEIKNQKVSEFLERPPRWLTKWGVYIFTFLMLSFLILSIYYTVSDKIKCRGLITTTRPVQSLFFPKDNYYFVFSKDSDTVKRGDVLAFAQKGISYETYLKLKSEMNKITYDAAFSLVILSGLGELQESYDALYFAMYSQVDANSLNNNKKIITDDELLLKRNLLSNVKLKNRMELFNQQKKDLRNDSILFKKGYLSEELVRQKLKEVNDLEFEIKSIITEVEYLNTSLNQNKLLKEDNVLRSNLVSQESRQNVIRLKNHLIERFHEFEKENVVDAQVDGVVSSYVNSFNLFAKQSEKFVDIIPIDREIQIIASLPISDISNIYIGQKVLVKSDHYPSEKFGYIVGNISSIGWTPLDGMYKIEVSLKDGLLTSLKKRLPFSPNMSCSLDVITKNESLINKVLKKNIL